MKGRIVEAGDGDNITTALKINIIDIHESFKDKHIYTHYESFFYIPSYEKRRVYSLFKNQISCDAPIDLLWSVIGFARTMKAVLEEETQYITTLLECAYNEVDKRADLQLDFIEHAKALYEKAPWRYSKIVFIDVHFTTVTLRINSNRFGLLLEADELEPDYIGTLMKNVSNSIHPSGDNLNRVMYYYLNNRRQHDNTTEGVKKIEKEIEEINLSEVKFMREQEREKERKKTLLRGRLQ